MSSERDTPREWAELPVLQDGHLPQTEGNVEAALRSVLAKAAGRPRTNVATTADRSSVVADTNDTALAELALGVAMRRAERGDYAGTLSLEEIAAITAGSQLRRPISDDPTTAFLDDLCDLSDPNDG